MRLSAFLAAAAVLTAAPAIAAEPDWAEANSSYLDGRAAETTPVTTGEFAQCAAYWKAWADATKAGKVPDAAYDDLDQDLWEDSAPDQAKDWAAAAAKLETPAEQIEAAQPGADLDVAHALERDASATKSVFEMLGLCRVPSE